MWSKRSLNTLLLVITAVVVAVVLARGKDASHQHSITTVQERHLLKQQQSAATSMLDTMACRAWTTPIGMLGVCSTLLSTQLVGSRALPVHQSWAVLLILLLRHPHLLERAQRCQDAATCDIRTTKNRKKWESSLVLLLGWSPGGRCHSCCGERAHM